MSNVTALAHEDADGARWSAWVLRYLESSRRGTISARIAFAILLAGTAAWLGFQLLSRPV